MTDKSNFRTQFFLAVVAGIFVIAAAIVSSPHWFKYLFPNQSAKIEKIDSQKINNQTTVTIDREEIEKSGTEDLIINKLELCPTSFNMPSYFFIEIKNTGTRNLKNVMIYLDFGKSKYEKFDYSRLVQTSVTVDSMNKSYIKLLCPSIKENDYIQLYALTTNPIFDKILLQADNMIYSKEYSYKNYIDTEINDRDGNNWFIKFLWILLVPVIIFFTIYFIIVLTKYLNRLFDL